MKIPFSPPFINDLVRKEVDDVLNSGWITTGPKTKELEDLICSLYGIPSAVGVNSWTSGTLMLLKWWGIGAGDEVIIPAYTYAATALTVLHAGATPVIVDVKDDFTIDPIEIKRAITDKTKAIIAVDFAGLPCDYDALHRAIVSNDAKNKFRPSSKRQRQLGRILVISDAAHSIGASYKGKHVGSLTDFTVLSLHAVKNITSAEGGIICINLPEPFDNQALYPEVRRFSLNGQTKDAFTKTQAGSWRYDIVEAGMKCNLPDLNAALALGQLKQYGALLNARKIIHHFYNDYFSGYEWAALPIGEDEIRESSYHIYPIRIKGISEAQRDQIIQEITHEEVAVNVHFIPLPLLSLFKDLGYRIEGVPKSFDLYEGEISLPIYPQLNDEAVLHIAKTVVKAVEKVCK